MNKKVPNQFTDRKSEKHVRIKAFIPTNKPTWRFSTVDKSGQFKWPKGDASELEIVQKLHEFDSMTWEEIQGKQHHFLSVDSLSKAAKDRLEEIQLDDDIEQLFSFHLQGKPRIIAIRHANVANLLWYDPDHEVAPSKKKHT